MCRFFSAIVLESGDILTSEYTDRHELLMRVHGVRDGHAQRGRFARVELLPPDDHRTLLDVETWNIQLDETEAPEWWPARRDDVQGAMRRMVERMIVREPRDLILGGCWVVSDVAIGELAAGRIAILSGGACPVWRASSACLGRHSSMACTGQPSSITCLGRPASGACTSWRVFVTSSVRRALETHTARRPLEAYVIRLGSSACAKGPALDIGHLTRSHLMDGSWSTVDWHP